MRGFYVTGADKAHNRCNTHSKIFNTQMIGTFNVRVPGLKIKEMPPSIVLPNKSYWFISLEKDKVKYYGWAIRDFSSKQAVNIVEILTKELLPVTLKEGDLRIKFLKTWKASEIEEWAKRQYWFQTFPFTPVKKADSALIWDTIKDHADWSGKKVLDFGCHYGYFSFEASKAGAIVRGVENNTKTLNRARIIRDNIILQDVSFSHTHKPTEWNKPYDVVFYFSVHHQIDPNYSQLKATIEKYKKMARECLFVELIMPPMFPKDKSMTENQINNIVGGEVLLTYKHKVRGMRRIYKVTI